MADDNEHEILAILGEIRNRLGVPSAPLGRGLVNCREERVSGLEVVPHEMSKENACTVQLLPVLGAANPITLKRDDDLTFGQLHHASKDLPAASIGPWTIKMQEQGAANFCLRTNSARRSLV